MPARLLLTLWLALLPAHAWAVNWPKAMQMYYQDFDPVYEMLITLAFLVVVIGGGILFSRWRRKRREERIARLKGKSHDYHDSL